MYLFFNFSGRLTRQPFIILCFALLGMYTVTAVLFVGLAGGFTGLLLSSEISRHIPDLRSLDVGFTTAFIVFAVTLVLLIFVSLISLCVRRLHDRDKSGWWLFAYFFASIVIMLSGGYMAKISFMTLFLIFFAVQCLLSLWFFIDLCLRRGTNGPNLYGSDPLSGSVADAAIFG